MASAFGVLVLCHVIGPKLRVAVGHFWQRCRHVYQLTHDCRILRIRIMAARFVALCVLTKHRRSLWKISRDNCLGQQHKSIACGGRYFLMKLRHNVGSAKGTIAGSRVGARTMLQPLLRKSFLGFDID
jgi:hypothetical protein